jgi:Raf kinase inhibitor-like YbhB/YbcL family protein
MVQTVKFGRMIRFLHAGEAKLACRRPRLAKAPKTINLSSNGFQDNQTLPLNYTASGDNVSPPLTWENLPTDTREIAILVEDADAPLPAPFVHAIAFGIDPTVSSLPEGALSEHKHGQTTPHSLRMGLNTLGRTWYYGPAPIAGHGVHRYHFQIFALNEKLDFRKPPSRRTLLKELEKHILAHGELMGTFERS